MSASSDLSPLPLAGGAGGGPVTTERNDHAHPNPSRGREGLFAPQSSDLNHLRQQGRHRALAPRRGVDFASNDYLGLAASGLLADAARAALDRGVRIGSGGSRLLGGNDPEHEALEAEAAAFFGSEAALFFASGYHANSALFATLPQTGDLILHDDLVHASVHEGLRLSRGRALAFRHNDVADARAAIADFRCGGGTGRVWIALESVYSMDGDQAPLEAFAALAEESEAVLVVDEAHATGVFGEQGRGLAKPADNLIALRTFGKALGCEGAVICAPTVVREFLVNRARGLIFSTAPSPLMAAVARAALRICADADHLRDALWRRVRLAEQVLAPHGVIPTGSPILPVIVGEDRAAVDLARRLQAEGLDVRAIRPPTVPQGTARLRVAITNNATEDGIRRLGEILQSCAASS